MELTSLTVSDKAAALGPWFYLCASTFSNNSNMFYSYIYLLKKTEREQLWERNQAMRNQERELLQGVKALG